MHLTLPPQINSDALLPFLNLLSLHLDEPSLTLDSSQLKRISPAGFSSLTAWQDYWQDYRKKPGFITQPKGITTCPIQPYLQRFNLLRLCEWTDEPETFLRRDTNSRFIPLEQIDHRVEDLGECLAPDGSDPESPFAGLWDATWDLITEMANNVRQHSCGEGFASAQFTQSDDFVRIAIADSGKGIPTVLRDGLVDVQKLDDVSRLSEAKELEGLLHPQRHSANFRP